MHVIGTAGHVDHGKSALVKAITGINPDRLREEQEREMTIDLGFAWLTLPGGADVGIIDVPGHRDFIENMLAGVGGIHAVIFVVAADEGVMPQTREHLAILDLLEVKSGLIALTKIDLIDDPEWLELVETEVAEAVAGTVLEDAPVVPVSAHTGAGLDRLVAVLQDVLKETPPRPDRGHPRLWVDRVFTISGFGTVVTGTLVDGSLEVGQEVVFLPGGAAGRIRGLQTHKAKRTRAVPGSRVAVNVSGVTKDEVLRGQLLTTPGWLSSTVLVDVCFRHLADASRPLKHNAEVKVFTGSKEGMARVRLLDARTLAPGETGWLQLRLQDEAPLVRGDRFILRYPSPGETIGGGVVVDPAPGHRWKRMRSEVVARLETLARGTPGERAAQALDAAGEPLNRAALGKRAGMSGDELSAAVDEALRESGVVALGGSDLFVSAAVWDRLARRIEDELSAYHKAEPLQPGMSREALRSRLGLAAPAFNAVVARAAAQGCLVESRALARLPGHVVRFSPAQQARIDQLMGQFARAPYAPPSYKEAVEIVGEDVLRALVGQGRLVQVQPDVLLAPEVYDEMTAAVREIIRAQGEITARELRDRFDTTRKYAIGLLEHLDATGVTRRVGDVRVLA
ncbi:MAG: selenocysteine-specific translation elongation factor [Anaerolineae bacterium]|nr:selenocysteine-specific translation elongation factor [Anaerolineae bacterium]